MLAMGVIGGSLFTPASLAQSSAGGMASSPAAAAPSASAHAFEPDWRRGRSPELLALLDDYVDWILRNDPLGASRRGDERFNDQLPDLSPEAVARRNRESADMLARLTDLDASRFSAADAMDADLLRWELASRVEEAKFFPEQTPVDLQSGPQVRLPQMADSLPFRTPKQGEDFATRLERVPALIEQSIAQMRAGLAAGRVPPRVAVNGTWDQCFLIASDDIAETPALSPFYKPFRALPASDPAAARARKAITDGIVPAYRALGKFLRDEYYPKCRASIAASDGIDGRARYDFALRDHTTTLLNADEIHAIGLNEVARIRAEMMQVIARSDFPSKDKLSGDELFAAFVTYLRTDSRFYHTSAEDLLTGYRDICKRMDAELPRLFGRLPRLPYGVRPTPDFAAPMAPTAYYYSGSMVGGVPGYFLANTYRLDQRPKYEMIALALHEAVPGHHLQIALAQELDGQHPFREFLGFNSFVEGWGLYSERLGLEVGGGGGGGAGDAPLANRGLYSDPYDDFGRLTYEMWRACRLVVDPGMHALGWSRDRAIKFMEDNTALSRHNIEREIDRYIAWPGQATAYKIGQLKISELRARAEKELGPKFDIRSFHDAVLDSGAIPLPALEARIDRWIATQK